MKFDPKEKYGMVCLWQPEHPTGDEQRRGVVSKSEALKMIRRRIAETIPRGYRTKVKFSFFTDFPPVGYLGFRKWRMIKWLYEP